MKHIYVIRPGCCGLSPDCIGVYDTYDEALQAAADVKPLVGLGIGVYVQELKTPEEVIDALKRMSGVARKNIELEGKVWAARHSLREMSNMVDDLKAQLEAING